MTPSPNASTHTPQRTSASENPSIGPKDNTPHHSADPICAALYAETHTSPPPSVTGSAAKCPIRYLDQHSPEEVAKYFETHKHEIPRSHEVCVKRYQRNEEDIRKLDAKYGNLAAMISGLGAKHQPMLPAKEEEVEDYENSKHTNARVENWAQTVSADGAGQHDTPADTPKETDEDEDDDRKSRFDRPMKEVRLGESPSRPWGIAVPYVEPLSTSEMKLLSTLPTKMKTTDQPPKPTGKCPFGHGQKSEQVPIAQPEAKASEQPQVQPTFIQPQDAGKGAAGPGPSPQMVFTGPVFIGYPMEQAMALMQQWQAGAAASGSK